VAFPIDGYRGTVHGRVGCQTLRLPWEFGGARVHPKQTGEAAMLYYAAKEAPDYGNYSE
jgi:hypothetical protein